MVSKSGKFLKLVEDNMSQSLSAPTSNDTLLHLLFENREGFVGDMMVGASLGHSNDEIVELKIFGKRRRKVSTLNFKRANFKLLRELVCTVLWE